MQRPAISPVLAILLTCTASLFAQDKDIKALANNFADNLARLSKKTVAVVDFNDLQGNVTELGRYLAEQVSVALASSGKGIEVIDRTHLKVLLQENKLGTSGIIDPATAKKLGQIAGVDVLVTGSLTPFGDSVQLAVKALDAATAHIITATTTDIAKTKAIEELLSRGISTTAANLNDPPGSIPRPPDSRQAQTQKGLELNLTSCQHRGDNLICEFRVKNLLEDREYHLLGKAYETVTRAVDERGNMYPADQVRLGDQTDSNDAKTILPSGISVIGRIGFTHVSADFRSLSLLEIRFCEDWNNRPGGPKFQLHNIPVIP